MLADPVKYIKTRKSFRNYNGAPVKDDAAKKLNDFTNKLNAGPFGNNCNFYIINTDLDIRNFYKLGTYGFIQNARTWIVSSVSGTGIRNLEDLGYLMEMLVLYATSIGLQTCWVGGNFSEKYFAGAIKAPHGHIIPAICSVGESAPYQGALASIIKWTIQSEKRKAWEKLFFLDDFKTPLAKSDVEKYAIPLEMVRLAPSSSNLQPWRIVKESSRNVYHFFLKRNQKVRQVQNIFNVHDLQRIDMGVAMCHFAETAMSKDEEGRWLNALPQFRYPSDLEYISSWYCG